MPLSLLLVANERPLINIDVTLFVNLGVWAVLFFFLRAVLWKPMLDLIDAREAGTEGAPTPCRTENAPRSVAGGPNVHRAGRTRTPSAA